MNVGILKFKHKVFTLNQVLEAAVVCAVIGWIFRGVGHSLTLHETSDADLRTQCVSLSSCGLEQSLFRFSDSACTYSHFANCRLLQKELEVVDLPGGWRRVCRRDHVGSCRHKLQHMSKFRQEMMRVAHFK